MFKNRTAMTAGSVAAALLAHLFPASRSKIVSVPPRTRGVRQTASTIATLASAMATPRLKKPRTSGDFEAITRAQLKRDRRAAKLERDTFIQRCTYYMTRDAAVAEEARRVHDLLGERAA